MTYKETGFRAVYHQFCAFPITKKIRSIVTGLPDIEQADYVLTYGYIDSEAGVTLEVIAAGKRSDDRFRFFEADPHNRVLIRMDGMESARFLIIPDDEGNLKNRYSAKIEPLTTYDVSEEVEHSRTMVFLDGCRHPFYPDDVQVLLIKEGLNHEQCWARINGLGDHCIMGLLLNEPNQDFGYHNGEQIGFFVRENEDKSVICYTNMTPSRKLTQEDLADGTLLKEAIITFNRERTNPHFIDIMEFLRDSYVWVPCNSVLSDVDRKKIEELINGAGKDLDSVVGKTFSNDENIRMIPDILQNGDDYFFPVFTSADEMGEYGRNFSKVEKHFLETISLARNNDKHVKGIVVNAFTEPFILEAGLFDVVEKMKTRISE